MNTVTDQRKTRLRSCDKIKRVCLLAVLPLLADGVTAAAATWYVDPVNGHDSNALIAPGDGSAANPWKTLSEVIASGNLATAPTSHAYFGYKTCSSRCIQPGDTVLLLSGNHGNVRIQGWYGNPALGLIAYDNNTPIIFRAARGATPLITQLKLIGGKGFAFQGITFESENPTGIGITTKNGDYHDYHLLTLSGPHANITVANNTFKSRNTPYTNIAAWLNKRASGISELGGTNITITGNTFRYVGFGIGFQDSAEITISNNTIDYFSDDAIDYAGTNVLITGNLITNCVEDGDGFHRDGMQGQPHTETSSYSNITITGNTIVRDADPANPFPGTLQGIDEFDGVWANVTVANNAVSTDAGQAISFNGATGVVISNNQVIKDAGRTLPCYNLQLAECETKRLIYHITSVPFIGTGHNNGGVFSSNVSISGNTAPSILVGPKIIGATIKNNVCHLNYGKCIFAFPIGGKVNYSGSVGIYGSNNIIRP